MTREQLEFAISQYLDGTLPADERAALERRLADDPAARELLEEYRHLDSVLKTSAPLPNLDWNTLAAKISETIPAVPADDELELAVVRYVDGELSQAESNDLEQRAAADGATRRLLAEHRSLLTVLKHAWPLPAINWSLLSQRISDAIEESAAPVSYSLQAYLRPVLRFAIAACMILAIGLAIRFSLPQPPAPTPLVQIAVAGPETAPAAAVVNINISPSDTFARRSLDPYYSGIVTVPSRVVVANTPRTQSADIWMPY